MTARHAGRATGLARRLPWLPILLGAAHFLVFTGLTAWQRGTVMGGDSGHYLQMAEALREGRWIGQLANVKPLGYSLAIAALGWLPGPIAVHAILVNAACYLATIWLIGPLARGLGCRPRVAWVTQLGFALLPNFPAWGNLIMSDTLAMALLAAATLAALRLAEQDGARIPWRPAAALALALGLLTLTRTEYTLLVPAAMLLAALRLRDPGHGRSVAALATALALLVGGYAAARGVQWLASGRGVPPHQSGGLQLWAGRYDFEFTQLRLFRLVDVVFLVNRAPETPDAELREGLERLRHAPEEPPIPDAVLAAAEEDLQRLRRIVETSDLVDEPAFRALAIAWVRERPMEFLGRAARRLLYYVTGAERDWPRTHPVHRLYTVAYRPFSTAGYAALIALAMWSIGRRRGRARLAIAAVPALFPVAVHACFIYEQRFGYPAAPLVVVILGMAWQQVRVRWRSARR
jgi:hypothetical protein